MARVLDRRTADARGRAELYVRSERGHALREALGEGAGARSRRARRDADADAAAARDALGAAVAAARAEAAAVRAEAAAYRADAAALADDEVALWHAARQHAADVDAFRARRDALLGKSARRRDADRGLDALAEALDRIDVDRAQFDELDRYVRAVCKQLEPKTDDTKIIGTPMGVGADPPDAHRARDAR
jgi:hypothetical protein